MRPVFLGEVHFEPEVRERLKRHGGERLDDPGLLARAGHQLAVEHGLTPVRIVSAISARVLDGDLPACVGRATGVVERLRGERADKNRSQRGTHFECSPQEAALDLRRCPQTNRSVVWEPENNN